MSNISQNTVEQTEKILTAFLENLENQISFNIAFASRHNKTITFSVGLSHRIGKADLSLSRTTIPLDLITRLVGIVLSAPEWPLKVRTCLRCYQNCLN